MPDFAYTARDLHGNRVNGIIAAGTQREAIASLSGQSLFPIEVKQSKQQSGKRRSRGRVGGQLMATTYGQLSGLLRSGVPMLRSLRVLRDQTSNARLAEVLEDVHGKVEDGATLADAMSRHPRVFRDMAVNMVRAGGEGGFLEDALERVATFTEQQEDLKSRTMGAMAYPIFLAFAGVTVVTCLLIFVVPNFEDIFEQLRNKGELPWITEWLLAFSSSLKRWWPAALAVIAGAFFLIRSRLQTEQGQLLADKIKLKLPLAGSIFSNLAVARFCRVLGTLLHNGVPILRSLEISRDAAGNKVLSQAVQAASENVTAGDSLAKPLSTSKYFPGDVVEMIAVAEESNSLERVLIEIADSFERRTSRKLELMVRLLEPIMLLILACMVLVVVLALLLPVLKMSSTLG
ncbi:MAG: type II secretion system F family protein [Pirellulaceae bacterium]|nr:type II secretion system F family protein [Planctomycetales bacterium]